MRGGALLLLAALAGCDQMSDKYARQVAEDSQRRAMDAQAEVEQMKVKLTDMSERQTTLYNYVHAVDEGQTALRKTVNGNADINNENAVREMTRRGACGREWVQYENGGYGWMNNTCTKDDLKK